MANKLEMLFSEAAETAVSGLKAVVLLSVLVLVHGRTTLNIPQFSRLLK